MAVSKNELQRPSILVLLLLIVQIVSFLGFTIVSRHHPVPLLKAGLVAFYALATTALYGVLHTSLSRLDHHRTNVRLLCFAASMGLLFPLWTQILAHSIMPALKLHDIQAFTVEYFQTVLLQVAVIAAVNMILASLILAKKFLFK